VAERATVSTPSTEVAPAGPDDAVPVAGAVRDAVTAVVRGKAEVVDLALTALLSGGHLLVEDLPGTGKTLLGKALAAAIGGRFGRVQCTPDLLPSDITGTSVYAPADGSWSFRPGPLFAHVALVDEVNRASPRTQSALLEPMEEHQVTVDGTTHPLPVPFFCIATQNPHGQVGTFPLPESQLDRFAIVTTMGLPGRDAERDILLGAGGLDVLGRVAPVTRPEAVARAQEGVRAVHHAPPIVEYVLDLVAATRTDPALVPGASPRAALGLLRAAQAWAVVAGRGFVTPDDVQAVAVAGLAHRTGEAAIEDRAASARRVADLVARVPVPRAR
jgi:MoxR-like ATPase